jgi:DAK2 domain fusion protein YloV
VLGEHDEIDGPTVARAFRSASDAAYRAVRRPVEGTMLTVIREMAEEAEQPDVRTLPKEEVLPHVVARGEDALRRTPEMLSVLKEAGVVDAGGAGLVEIIRGLTAAVIGQELPAAPAEDTRAAGLDAVHQELSRYRYCTVFVVEGERLDVDALERELEQLGDSLLVVGDPTALKVHVHTDDPGAALSLGTRAGGTLEGIEIADMHRQTTEREGRLVEALDHLMTLETGVVVVAPGEGNRRLFESMRATRVIEGGQTMNPSTADIVAAIEATPATEVIVLPNNQNVILSAEQAVGLVDKPVRVVPTRTVQAGLAAMVAYDPERSGSENARAMEKAQDRSRRERSPSPPATSSWTASRCARERGSVSPTAPRSLPATTSTRSWRRSSNVSSTATASSSRSSPALTSRRSTTCSPASESVIPAWRWRCTRGASPTTRCCSRRSSRAPDSRPARRGQRRLPVLARAPARPAGGHRGGRRRGCR